MVTFGVAENKVEVDLIGLIIDFGGLTAPHNGYFHLVMLLLGP